MSIESVWGQEDLVELTKAWSEAAKFNTEGLTMAYTVEQLMKMCEKSSGSGNDNKFYNHHSEALILLKMLVPDMKEDDKKRFVFQAVGINTSCFEAVDNSFSLHQNIIKQIEGYIRVHLPDFRRETLPDFTREASLDLERLGIESLSLPNRERGGLPPDPRVSFRSNFSLRSKGGGWFRDYSTSADSCAIGKINFNRMTQDQAEKLMSIFENMPFVTRDIKSGQFTLIEPKDIEYSTRYMSSIFYNRDPEFENISLHAIKTRFKHDLLKISHNNPELESVDFSYLPSSCLEEGRKKEIMKLIKDAMQYNHVITSIKFGAEQDAWLKSAEEEWGRIKFIIDQNIGKKEKDPVEFIQDIARNQSENDFLRESDVGYEGSSSPAIANKLPESGEVRRAFNKNIEGGWSCCR